MKYSLITFNVPFTAKPKIPYHIESCGIVLSVSDKFHPDSHLKNKRILDITIYFKKESFNINKAKWLLKEFVLFLNLRWSSFWSLNYLLSLPYSDIDSEIKEVENIEEWIGQIPPTNLSPIEYFDFDHYANGTVEISVPPLNVKEDFPKYLQIVLSEEQKNKRFTQQMLVFVLGDNSDKFLFPLFDNINLKYSLLTSVCEDFLLDEPQNKKDTYKIRLKHFLSNFTTDKRKQEIYFQLFEDIYQHRNLFTHTLHHERRDEQIETLLTKIPKFGYTLSDHIAGGVGRLGGEDIFSHIIRKHLIEKLKTVKVAEGYHKL